MNQKNKIYKKKEIRNEKKKEDKVWYRFEELFSSGEVSVCSCILRECILLLKKPTIKLSQK